MYHCDIKPGNIMINENKDIFLIDIDSISYKVRHGGFGHTSAYSPCNILI
jgi:serine/threonine protein kinase